MALKKYLGLFLKVLFAMVISGALLIQCNSSSLRLKMGYIQDNVLVNPAGTCAMVEYKFSRGERGLDFSNLFSSGNAFYRIVDLRTGKTIRDSSNAGIRADSLDVAGMGHDVFYWSRDGKTAAFPGGEGPYYEWTDLVECEGMKNASEFSGLNCHSGLRSGICLKLQAKL